ncbi:DUF4398 domain-containing protein [Cognatiluteimonas profundi]|uniref:DUF4398 domain-containing protein n=1 Tax=Cognatiluteimonas profundi TaxID=2594501 RepID=UPI00131AE24A|nr:DUF4398 domain-containing protein [Lysobacter profundi]
MNPSFAQFPSARQQRPWHSVRLLTSCVFMLAGCATLPPPTGELSAAQQAVTRAGNADADQYAGAVIAQARDELAQAQAAMGRGRDDDARTLAVAAAADADLAYASSTAATTRADFVQHRQEIGALQQRLQMPADIEPQSPLDDQPQSAVAAAAPPDAAQVLAGRMLALESDPRLNAFAAYERLIAHQALDSLAAARSRSRDNAARIAERRVSIAELAARTQATRRAIDGMERQRSELLVEASRQDAERARQEAEQLRVQAQVQAEEAQRLREQADAEAAARQQAEEVIVDVGASETAKLKAARDKESALARQEAELMAAGEKSAPEAKSRKSAPVVRKPAAKKKKGK